MEIHRERIGVAADDGPEPGVAVDSYTLTACTGSSITLWTYGATLVEVLQPDRAGRHTNVIVRLPDLATYQNRLRNPYVGATVGRFCRCVRDGVFSLDGVRHMLDRNDGHHHLHGGTVGFDRRVWRARAERDTDGAAVVMKLVSRHGDQGYPGELHASVAYHLDRLGHRLTIDFRATTNATTIVGLTNHAFWNLAGSGVVDDHSLALNAKEFLPFDAELLPSPEGPKPVTEGALDYRRPRRIGAARLDNFFILDGTQPAAEIYDPHSGRRMRVSTDQPGVGVYTADHFHQRRAGICLETGAWPDAPNLPAAPTVRLDPGATYRHRTTHEFSVGATPRCRPDVA